MFQFRLKFKLIIVSHRLFIPNVTNIHTITAVITCRQVDIYKFFNKQRMVSNAKYGMSVKIKSRTKG